MRVLDDPAVRASWRLSLLQRAQRLSKHVKTGTSNKIRHLPDINYISAPVVCYLNVPIEPIRMAILIICGKSVIFLLFDILLLMNCY